MNALILSHQKTLLPLLQDTLNPMSAMARVRCSGAAPLDAGEQNQHERPDLVFVDLAWCGMSAAPALLRELRRTLRRAPLVLLVDRPEEVTLAQLADVHADLYIGKSVAPRVMRRSLRRWFTPTGDEPATQPEVADKAQADKLEAGPPIAWLDLPTLYTPLDISLDEIHLLTRPENVATAGAAGARLQH
jgi:DNA-binding response OmpR family regulator